MTDDLSDSLLMACQSQDSDRIIELLYDIIIEAVEHSPPTEDNMIGADIDELTITPRGGEFVLTFNLSATAFKPTGCPDINRDERTIQFYRQVIVDAMTGEFEIDDEFDSAEPDGDIY